MVDKAIADGMRGMALTDHGNMMGIKDFFNYTEKVISKAKKTLKELNAKLSEIESGAYVKSSEEENPEWPVYNKYTIVTPESDEEQTEEEALANSYVLQNLNKGKTWVGWISQNNGGSVSSN
jgi:hypothetical protein